MRKHQIYYLLNTIRVFREPGRFQGNLLKCLYFDKKICIRQTPSASTNYLALSDSVRAISLFEYLPIASCVLGTESLSLFKDRPKTYDYISWHNFKTNIPLHLCVEDIFKRQRGLLFIF